MAVEIPTVDTVLVSPNRGSPQVTFRTKMDQFLDDLPDAVVEMNSSFTAMNEAGALIESQAEDVATKQALATAAATSASASANSALLAPGTNATSTDTRTIATVVGAGVISATMTPGKLYIPGQTMFMAAAPPNAANRLVFDLLTYNSLSGAFTGVIVSYAGSGEFSSWNLGLTSSIALPMATKEDLWAGTDTGKVVTAAVLRAAEEWQLLTAVGSTITWNPAIHGWNAYAVLAPGSQTLAITTAGLQPGRAYQFQPIQRASGSASTLIQPSALKYGLAGTPVLSTTVNAREVIRFVPLDAACTYLDAKFTKAA